jgi:hypothetical protein
MIRLTQGRQGSRLQAQGVFQMALRPATKVRSKEMDQIETPRDPAHQRKKPEERYWLQVDRQTKKSFSTLAPAEAAGELIKKAHPIVQVSIYDSVDCVNTLIGADPTPARAATETSAAED